MLWGIALAAAAAVVVVGLRVSFSVGYRHGKRDALWPPRDVPARVPRGVPVCTFWLTSPTNLDWAVFDSTMRQFAALHAFQQCQITSWSLYSGPNIRLASFINDQFVIWSGSRNGPPMACPMRLAPRHHSFSVTEFQQLTNALAGALQAEFPGRVGWSTEDRERW